MNDMPHFDDSDLPDFDSMSQEELIAWLEQLAKSQSETASEFIDDFDEADAAGSPADDETADWSEWLADETPVAGPPNHDRFADADEETPVDLSLFDDEDTAPTAAMDWLDAITAKDVEPDLPDIADYRMPEAPAENLAELLTADEGAEPLDWLDSLAGEVIAAAQTARSKGESATNLAPDDDFDDSYEDDESLDDLEDESLYSRNAESAKNFLESLLGVVDRESEQQGTKSMPPAPDFAAPDDSSETRSASALIGPRLPQTRAEPSAKLTQAFLQQDQQSDLEAWYAGRLRAITSQTKAAPLSADLPPAPNPAKPPPPGLAAAIYSARGKIDSDDLRNALADYETLLRTSAGLEWVVGDMRALITQNKFRRNPSVHRVLGDALMRQGRLDAALDVYRHALSLL